SALASGLAQLTTSARRRGVPTITPELGEEGSNGSGCRGRPVVWRTRGEPRTLMERRRLGRDGPEVPVLGLGFWSIAGAFGGRDDAEAERTVARAIDLGVTFFDTAPAYGDAEEFLGRVLGPG